MTNAEGSRRDIPSSLVQGLFVEDALKRLKERGGDQGIVTALEDLLAKLMPGSYISFILDLELQAFEFAGKNEDEIRQYFPKIQGK